MLKLLIILTILLSTPVLGYTKSENSLNISINVYSAAIIKDENSLNATLFINNPSLLSLSSLNFSIPDFGYYQLRTTISFTTTSTSTTTIAIAGGGGGGGVICPPNSHSIEDNICICDFGYAKSSEGDCIASVFSFLPGARTRGTPLTANVLFVIIVVGILIAIIFGTKERREKVKKRVKAIKKQPKKELEDIKDRAINKFDDLE